MEEHYGRCVISLSLRSAVFNLPCNIFRSEPESVAIIKQLYEDLTLPNTYAIYEEESFNIIKTHIQQISKGLRHDLFFNIMEKLYKREC